MFHCFLVGLALSSSFSQSTVFIVRQAEKADNSKDAELSETGPTRADALANMLRDSKISAIYTTEFKPTQQTFQTPFISASSISTFSFFLPQFS